MLRHGYTKILLTLLLVAGVTVVFQLLGASILFIWTSIRGISISQASSIAELSATGIAQILIMLIGTYFLIRFFRQDPIVSLRLEGARETPATAYLLAIPVIFATQFVGSMLAVLWEHALMHAPSLYSGIREYEDTLEQATKGAALSVTTLPHALIVFVSIAIIPPLAEEVFFRGFTQTNIERSGKNGPRPIIAIIVTGIAFSMMHLEPIEFPGLLLLGLALGWMSYRTNNVLVGSVAHAANNGIIVLLLMIVPNAEQSETASSLIGTKTTEIGFAIIMLAVTLPILGLSLYLFHLITRPLAARYNSTLEWDALEEASVASLQYPEETIT